MFVIVGTVCKVGAGESARFLGKRTISDILRRFSFESINRKFRSGGKIFVSLRTVFEI